MSDSERTERLAAIQRLKAEIIRLRKLQLAAQNMGAIRGMTADESLEYKERHIQIEQLSKQVKVLNHGMRRH